MAGKRRKRQREEKYYTIKWLLVSVLYFATVFFCVLVLDEQEELFAGEWIAIVFITIALYLAAYMIHRLRRKRRSGRIRQETEQFQVSDHTERRCPPGSHTRHSGKISRKIRKGSKSKKIRIVAACFCFLAVGAVFRYGLWKSQVHDPIPASLIELREKYPEAAEFVNDYPQKKGKHQKIDLSGEVQKGTIPLFLQWDERWGYETYGDDFLAVTGCGPTCVSMVVCGLTGETEWDPLQVARFSDSQGYYVPNEGTSWDLMTEGAGFLGLNGRYGEVSADFIRENAASGFPMICSMYPGDFTSSGHFIVLTGVDESGRIIVNDPNSRINSGKHWEMDEILPQIRSLWIYWLPD